MSKVQQYMQNIYGDSKVEGGYESPLYDFSDLNITPTSSFVTPQDRNTSPLSGLKNYLSELSGSTNVREQMSFNIEDYKRAVKSGVNPYEVYKPSVGEKLTSALINPKTIKGGKQAYDTISQELSATQALDAYSATAPAINAEVVGNVPDIPLDPSTMSPIAGAEVGKNFLGTGISTAGALGAGAIVGSVLDKVVDDSDPTTYTAKEVATDTAELGMGVGRILLGDFIGGGIQAISNLGDIIGSIGSRRRAKKAEEKRKEENEKYKKSFLSAVKMAKGREMSSQEAFIKQQDAINNAAALASTYEKYDIKMESGGKIKNNYLSDDYLAFRESSMPYGGRVSIMKPMGHLGKEMTETRPQELKYMKK
jgi:hypothetical protein|tara:strand:+ start:13152 stop:14249 length:1098 start_codon:yes stop_codon:yes gene_type:complete